MKKVVKNKIFLKIIYNKITLQFIPHLKEGDFLQFYIKFLFVIRRQQQVQFCC